MIKCWLDIEKDGLFHYSIKDEPLFDDIISMFKMNYCGYDKSTNSWTMDVNLKSKMIYDELCGFNKVEILDEDLDIIENLFYPPSDELRKIKFIADKELLNEHKPLVGKQGFENFQKDAISKLVKTNRALLDISCRHGKTYITCIAMGTLLKNNKIDKILIVCRPEGVQNFKSEILFFLSSLIKEEDIAIVSSSNRDIENYFDKKIIITNYITYRLSCEYYSKNGVSNKTRKPTIDFSKFGNNRLIILDEVQSINSHDSIQSHLLHIHKHYFEYRWGLSGTLGFNFLHWYSLAKFMLPDRIPYPYSEWRDFITKDFYHKNIDERRAKEFKEQILNKLLITYHDCIVQPLDKENIIYCDMNSKMRDIYKKLCNDFVTDIFKESNGNPQAKNVLNKFGTLASITSDPSLKDVKDWKFTDNPKLDVLKGLLEKYIDSENERVIVWSVHPQILNKLAIIFKKYNPLIVHGDEKTSVCKSDRNDVISEFRNNPDKKILFTNKVLSTSITISECSRQIYWDLPLSSDDINQSRERIRGPKQTKETETNFLIFDNSVDLYIWNEIIQKKSKTRDAILNKKTMSISDFKNLLNPNRQYYVDGTSV